jgi:hypothetical protein
VGRDRSAYRVICYFGKEEYFYAEDLTANG